MASIETSAQEWRLILRQPPTARLDMSLLTPLALSGMRATHIQKLPLWHGSRLVKVGDFFDVRGQGGDNRLRVVGGSPLFWRLGAGMADGFLVVEGDSGDETGLGMAGGNLRVLGHAGDFAGAGMRGGRLFIDGGCGDYAGARRPGYGDGHGVGMSGGLLAVAGDSGDRTGAKMCLGVIVVKGTTGDYCANDMRAGTLIALGGVGAMPGIGMARGTLLLGRRPRSLPAVFNHDGRCELVFISRLTRGLSDLHSWLHFPRNWDMLMDRHSGDMSISGKGEVLAPV